MNNKQITWVLLGMSIVFFLRKGIQYASLGSYVPLGFVLVFLLLLGLGLSSKPIIFMITARVWGILLIIWASVRLFFSVMTIFFKSLDEYHITQQFALPSLLLSIGILLIGAWLLRLLRFLRKHGEHLSLRKT